MARGPAGRGAGRCAQVARQEALLADYVAAEGALRDFTDRNFGRLCAICARWTLLAARTNEGLPAVSWPLSSWVTNCCNANHALESMDESTLAGIVASRQEGTRLVAARAPGQQGPLRGPDGDGLPPHQRAPRAVQPLLLRGRPGLPLAPGRGARWGTPRRPPGRSAEALGAPLRRLRQGGDRPRGELPALRAPRPGGPAPRLGLGGVLPLPAALRRRDRRRRPPGDPGRGGAAPVQGGGRLRPLRALLRGRGGRHRGDDPGPVSPEPHRGAG